MGIRGDYLMEISIGTPPVMQWAILDIASDIVWTQCLKCVKCFKQTQPKFNPIKSSSYQPIRCGAKTCKQLGNDINCIGSSSNCKYRLEYRDDSYSFGELATETFKLGNTYLPGMVYVCSNYNVGLFEKTNAGIVGLGNGPHSLISRLNPSIGGKFSYCLTDPSKGNARSKINFGNNANVSSSSRGSISTPLVLMETPDFYYITLEAISIKNMRFPFTGVTKILSLKGNKFSAHKGNVMIDTGTTLTYLHDDMYYELEKELISSIQDRSIPSQSNLKLCYKNRKNFQFPTIIFHFSKGANLALQMKNTIIQDRGQSCLAILPTNDTLAILGNILQMDHMIGFDLMRRKVSFRLNYC
ncbi:aspartic proteinase CDR1-like [Impatiens glandulifera]|uniref:aspartic proteinase CDR1-like n=1 Tax=Impatiens glandulifera TaxID=253017 RepID=UPI001FB174D2|nr:aspartic proteinase CDR1-like [Impatiens glandulifera]